MQCGSVELSLDPEGSYYASGHVTIKKGTYEGQLVIGDGFINPVKNFTVEKDDDTVILQFEVSREGRCSGYGGEGRGGEGRGGEGRGGEGRGGEGRGGEGRGGEGRGGEGRGGEGRGGEGRGGEGRGGRGGEGRGGEGRGGEVR